MYLIIGKPNCSRCEMVKSILDNKNIIYEYKYLDELSDEERKYYMNMAREKKQLAMPLIIKDGSIVQIQEVI